MLSGKYIRNLRSFVSNEQGNFAIFAAAAIPLMIATASFAVDTTNAFSMRSSMRNAADAAALATSSRLAKGELEQSDAKAYAKKFFEGMIVEDEEAYSGFTATPTITITPITDSDGRKSWEVNISVSATQDLTQMASLLGYETLTVGVHGKSVSAEAMQSAFSMVLAVDKSGSMSWYGENDDVPSNGNPKKIVSLKNAVGTLAATIEEADPDHKYSRLGAASYDSEMYKTKDLTWGATETKEFIDTLPARGGTSSTDAFAWAYNKLRTDTEDRIHDRVNGLTPIKYIVLMTDGDNNKRSDDYWTRYYCNLAKNEGITVYTVAFMAPSRGEALLSDCASSPAHYFDAANNDELVRAFENIGKAAAQMTSRLVE